MQEKTSKIAGLTASDLTIIFAEDEQTYLLSETCRKLGINTNPAETRLYTYYYHPTETDDSAILTETELKNWLNDQGTSEVFADAEEQENWERLMQSDFEENILLALNLLNTYHRPEDKYFAVWLGLANHHPAEKVKETAKALCRLYLTEEEFKNYAGDRFGTLIFMKFDLERFVQPFINLNWAQYWAKFTHPKSSIFNSRTIALTSSDVFEIITKPEFGRWIKDTIDELKYQIEAGDDFAGLDYLLDNFEVTGRITLVAIQPMKLNLEQLTYFDRPNFTLKNIAPPAAWEQAPSLTKVKHFTWEYTDNILFKNTLFPNTKSMTVRGDYAEVFVLNDLKDQLTSIEITLRKQQTLPENIYDCKNLKSLHVHYSTIDAFSPKIANLTNLNNLCTEGSLIKTFPANFFRLPKVKFMYGLSISEEATDFDAEHEYFGPNHLFFTGKTVEYFPYGLAKLTGLNELTFNQTSIQEVDERIGNFATLKKLSFEYHHFTELPTCFQLLKNLQSLSLWRGEISEISFDWVRHLNENGIHLSLRSNPVRQLPAIPIDFDGSQVVQNQGSIFLDKNSIAEEQVQLYRTVFGENFIG